QPVGEIAALCRERGAVLHTDAVQAVGHVPVSVRETGVDLLSLSAHKFGGPRGVGALYVREGVELEPLLYGGGQERGLRSGTTNVAGVVGLMTALESAVAELEAERVRLGRLRDQLQHRVLAGVPEARVNGGAADRLPHVLSVGLDGVGPDVLLPALDLAGLAVSAGSACHSGASAPSHVLLAMGREADAALRFSLGWSTTEEEVKRAARTFVEVVERVRSAAG
ncbi:MAG: cysteine desulfurase family protein, partial [Gemmatimonadota bacterium]